MTEAIDPTIFRLFAGLPQQGPGTDAETIAVLERIAHELPPAPEIIDFGCGTGRSTLALALRLDDAHITAIDNAEPFIATLRREVAARNLAHRVRALVCDMAQPPTHLSPTDLVWCEGAAYCIGFARALRTWRPLMRAGSLCVVSECEWLSADPPAHVAAFWRSNYPLMADRVHNRRLAEEAGFDVVATHVLAPDGWQRYYSAIAEAVRDGRAASLGTAFTHRLAEEQAIFRESQGSFGYVFYTLRLR